MADIHHLPNIKEVEREASEWIARLTADDVCTEDQTRFDAWLNAHPLHARTYEGLQRTWQEYADLGSWVRLAAVTSSAGAVDEASQTRRVWPRWAMAAAMLVAAVLLGFHLHSLTSDAMFQTALGERATISLPDGSTLMLNSNSKVRVDYSLRSRIIHLERGEAFFKVAHNASRPFWVTTGNKWVRAVGTAFNVFVNPKGVQVTVHEGTVKVGLEGRLLSASLSDETLSQASAELHSGEQADVQDGVTTTRKLSSEALVRAGGWRDGWLYFEQQNLCAVVDELNRYTSHRLVLQDPQLCSLAVGGAFQANPQGAEALLIMLEHNFDAHVRRDDGHAYIQAATSLAAQK